MAGAYGDVAAALEDHKHNLWNSAIRKATRAGGSSKDVVKTHMHAVFSMGYTLGLDGAVVVKHLGLDNELEGTEVTTAKFNDYCLKLVQLHNELAHLQLPQLDERGLSLGGALRKAFVQYARRSRTTWDPDTPRLPQQQLLRLCADAGLLEPAGTLSSRGLDIILASHRQESNQARLDYPTFLKVLAEVGAECQADAYVPVAALGLHTKPAPVLRAVALLPMVPSHWALPGAGSPLPAEVVAVGEEVLPLTEEGSEWLEQQGSQPSPAPPQAPNSPPPNNLRPAPIGDAASGRASPPGRPSRGRSRRESKGLRVGEDDYPSSTDSDCDSQHSQESNSPFSNGKPRHGGFSSDLEDESGEGAQGAKARRGRGHEAWVPMPGEVRGHTPGGRVDSGAEDRGEWVLGKDGLSRQGPGPLRDTIVGAAGAAAGAAGALNTGAGGVLEGFVMPRGRGGVNIMSVNGVGGGPCANGGGGVVVPAPVWEGILARLDALEAEVGALSSAKPSAATAAPALSSSAAAAAQVDVAALSALRARVEAGTTALSGLAMTVEALGRRVEAVEEGVERAVAQNQAGMASVSHTLAVLGRDKLNVSQLTDMQMRIDEMGRDHRTKLAALEDVAAAAASAASAAQVTSSSAVAAARASAAAAEASAAQACATAVAAAEGASQAAVLSRAAAQAEEREWEEERTSAVASQAARTAGQLQVAQETVGALAAQIARLEAQAAQQSLELKAQAQELRQAKEQVSQAVTGPPPTVLADSVACQEARLAALEAFAHTRVDGLKALSAYLEHREAELTAPAGLARVGQEMPAGIGVKAAQKLRSSQAGGLESPVMPSALGVTSSQRQVASPGTSPNTSDCLHASIFASEVLALTGGSDGGGSSESTAPARSNHTFAPMRGMPVVGQPSRLRRSQEMCAHTNTQDPLQRCSSQDGTDTPDTDMDRPPVSHAPRLPRTPQPPAAALAHLGGGNALSASPVTSPLARSRTHSVCGQEHSPSLALQLQRQLSQPLSQPPSQPLSQPTALQTTELYAHLPSDMQGLADSINAMVARAYNAGGGGGGVGSGGAVRATTLMHLTSALQDQGEAQRQLGGQVAMLEAALIKVAQQCDAMQHQVSKLASIPATRIFLPPSAPGRVSTQAQLNTIGSSELTVATAAVAIATARASGSGNGTDTETRAAAEAMPAYPSPGKAHSAQPHALSGVEVEGGQSRAAGFEAVTNTQGATNTASPKRSTGGQGRSKGVSFGVHLEDQPGSAAGDGSVEGGSAADTADANAAVMAALAGGRQGEGEDPDSAPRGLRLGKGEQSAWSVAAVLGGDGAVGDDEDDDDGEGDAPRTSAGPQHRDHHSLQQFNLGIAHPVPPPMPQGAAQRSPTHPRLSQLTSMGSGGLPVAAGSAERSMSTSGALSADAVGSGGGNVRRSGTFVTRTSITPSPAAYTQSTSQFLMPVGVESAAQALKGQLHLRSGHVVPPSYMLPAHGDGFARPSLPQQPALVARPVQALQQQHQLMQRRSASFDGTAELEGQQAGHNPRLSMMGQGGGASGGGVVGFEGGVHMRQGVSASPSGRFATALARAAEAGGGVSQGEGGTRRGEGQRRL